MIDHLIVLFVVVPLFVGIVTTLLRHRLEWARIASVIGLCSYVAIAFIMLSRLTGQTELLFSQAGDWPAPFGISLIFDGISSILLTAVSVVGLACGLHGIGVLPRRIEQTWFHPLLHFQLLGVNFSLLTGDLFNLFVAFEIMLMSSYALVALGGAKRQVAQAYKYLVLNLVASTLFVACAGLVYGMLGTLNMVDMARIVADRTASGEGLPPAFGAISALLLLVFAAKGAVFPLWFWLPDAYPTLPSSIAALFAALLSKVGIYAVLRLFPMALAAPGTDAAELSPVSLILPVVAGITMIVAVLGALGSTRLKRIVSLLLIAHVGYLIFGISLGLHGTNADALNGTLMYMAQEMIVIAGLMLCIGLIEQHTGTDDLHEFSGLFGRAPWLAGLTLVFAFAIAGIPPLPGIIGKVMLIREGLGERAWILTTCLLLTSVLTIVGAARLWGHAFLFPARDPDADRLGGEIQVAPVSRLGFAGVAVLVLGLVGATAMGDTLVRMGHRAAHTALHPEPLVESILGPGTWPDDPDRAHVALQDDTGTTLEVR